MKKRENPFADIYREANGGTNEEKRDKIAGGGKIPLYLDVELANLCNFHCRFCPTGTGAMNRMGGRMPDEVVEALVDNVSRYCVSGVRFSRWGEPTMHPKYIEILDRVKRAGALIHMNTNGSLLDEEQMNRLMDVHLDSIKFSFQGADEGSYNEMRMGGDYRKLLDTMRKFYFIRGDRDFPYIQVSTTLTGETAEQVEGFKKDVRDYCDYYNVGYTMLNHLNVEAMKVSDEEKDKIRRLQERESIKRAYREVCNEAFDKLSINWNGDATLCCTDYDNFMIVGNILDNDIKQIFNGRAAKIYRDAILNRQHGKIKCCSNCYETVPLTKN